MQTRPVVAALIFAVLLLSIFIACQDSAPTSAAQASGGQSLTAGAGNGVGGTLVQAGVSATSVRDFDWTLTSSLAPTEILIPQGNCAPVVANVNVNRRLVETVAGQVCVTNSGREGTENLHIEVTVYCRAGRATGLADDMICFGPEAVDVSGRPALNPDESACYDYSIPVTFDAGKTYKVQAEVTVTNHVGRAGTPFGPHPRSEFFQAGLATDSCATVAASGEPPVGFTLSETPASLTFTATAAGQFSLTVCNTSVLCGQLETLVNTVVLDECDSHTLCTTTAALTINTGDCPSGDEGCTPGYWKNNTGSWPPTGYVPNQQLRTAFSIPGCLTGCSTNFSSATMLSALSFPGGSGNCGAAEILLRAGVAALLNAAHPDVDFPRTADEVIDEVNDALASCARDEMLSMAAELDADNNRGCPLH